VRRAKIEPKSRTQLSTIRLVVSHVYVLRRIAHIG